MVPAVGRVQSNYNKDIFFISAEIDYLLNIALANFFTCKACFFLRPGSISLSFSHQFNGIIYSVFTQPLVGIN